MSDAPPETATGNGAWGRKTASRRKIAWGEVSIWGNSYLAAISRRCHDYHDWRDKLVSVQQGNTTTDILLDPLGRMVGKVKHTPDGDLARAYLHDGDQVVLEYVQAAGSTTWQPERRHLWGQWIDDLAVEQVDTDGDGTLETTLYPVTDLLGSVQLLTDDAGTPVERITYDPDGTPHFWSADTTRPTVTRIAWTGDGTLPTGDTVPAQAFEIGLSEPIDPASAANATATLTPDGGNGQTLTLTLAADGRAAYLTGATIQAGTTYALHVEGLTDTTHNPLWPEDATVTIADPNAYEVLDDTTAPQLLAVLDGPDALYLLFDEPVEPAAGYDMTTALSITRQGQPVEGTATRLGPALLAWHAADPGQWLPGGSYTVGGVHLTDLNANPATAGATFTHLNTANQMLLLAYQAPTDTQPEAASAYGLTTLFQGRTWHADLGMYCYRARWYLPEIGEFAERDPIDPSESVELYSYLKGDPLNSIDPTGLYRLRVRQGEAGRYVDAYAVQWGLSDALFHQALGLIPYIGPAASRISNTFEQWTNIPGPTDTMTNEEAIGVMGEGVAAVGKYALKGSSRVAQWLGRSGESSAVAGRSIGLGVPIATTVYSLWKSLDESSKDEMIFQMFAAFMGKVGKPIGGVQYVSSGKAFLDLKPKSSLDLDERDLNDDLRRNIDRLSKFNIVFRHDLPALLKSYDSVLAADKTFEAWESVAVHGDNSVRAKQRRFARFFGQKREQLYDTYHRNGTERQLDVMLDVLRRLWPNLYPSLTDSFLSQ